MSDERNVTMRGILYGLAFSGIFWVTVGVIVLSVVFAR